MGLACKTMSGDHDNSYHLIKHCLVCQLVYSKIPFILCNKCYYTIQKLVHKVSLFQSIHESFLYLH